MSHVFHGASRVASGDSDGLEEMQEGLRLAAGTGNQAGAPGLLGVLAEARAHAGHHDAALGTADMALAVAANTDQHFCDAWLYRLKGDVVLAAKPGQERDAEALFERALEIARSQQARGFELRAATSLARLWREQGRREEARALLQPVYAWFSEGFDTGDLIEANALLQELN